MLCHLHILKKNTFRCRCLTIICIHTLYTAPVLVILDGEKTVNPNSVTASGQEIADPQNDLAIYTEIH